MSQQRVWIAFGSNQNNPALQLVQAREKLGKIDTLQEQAASSLYRTPPVGIVAQPDFVNAVVRYQTTLSAIEILQLMLNTERELGRVRGVKNGPRVIDLDVLLIDEMVIQSEQLTVPHPRMSERAFVLLPLAEINADIIIPNAGKVSTLLDSINTNDIYPLECAQWQQH